MLENVDAQNYIVQYVHYPVKLTTMSVNLNVMVNKNNMTGFALTQIQKVAIIVPVITMLSVQPTE